MTATATKERGILFSAPMVRALLAGTKTQTRRVCVFANKISDKHDRVRIRLSKPGERTIEGIHRRFTISRDAMYTPTVREKFHFDCPYGKPGDRLWVRETWRPSIVHGCGQNTCDCDDVMVTYAADGGVRHFSGYSDSIPEEWTMPKLAKVGNVTPIHMPRWASRITLEITDVRVQRVQEISEADAIAEGLTPLPDGPIPEEPEPSNPADKEIYPGETAKEQFAQLWNTINGPGSWESNPWVWAVTFDPVAKPAGATS